MKKFLPKTSKNSHGFTLVELLVVISILAVLAIVGFAAFNGVAGRGNDVRRESDLDAIAKALEVNKTGTAYIPLAASQFSSGSLPIDPTTGRVYCITYSTTAQNFPATAPAAWTAGTCPTTGGSYFPGQLWVPLSTSTPVANTQVWKVCATLQNNTVSCRTSAQ